MIKIGSWVEIVSGPYRGERGRIRGTTRLYGDPEGVLAGWHVECQVPRGPTPCNRRRRPVTMYRAVRACDLRELLV